MTQVVSTALAVCRDQMFQGSAVSPSLDAQESCAQREYNKALGNAAGTLVSAIFTNVDDRHAAKLRLRVAGTAPGVGEPHFVFASDRFGQACRGITFDVTFRPCVPAAIARVFAELVQRNGNS